MPEKIEVGQSGIGPEGLIQLTDILVSFGGWASLQIGVNNPKDVRGMKWRVCETGRSPENVDRGGNVDGTFADDMKYRTVLDFQGRDGLLVIDAVTMPESVGIELLTTLSPLLPGCELNVNQLYK